LLLFNLPQNKSLHIHIPALVFDAIFLFIIIISIFDRVKKKDEAHMFFYLNFYNFFNSCISGRAFAKKIRLSGVPNNL